MGFGTLLHDGAENDLVTGGENTRPNEKVLTSLGGKTFRGTLYCLFLSTFESSDLMIGGQATVGEKDQVAISYLAT